MKRQILFAWAIMLATATFSQQFEAPKIDGSNFDKLKVHVGGDFAMQFQGLSQSADTALIPLGKGLNLPTANFTIDADLAPGVRVNLTTYLSSRHHTEAWVKGGYLLVDQMPFLNSAFFDNLMKYLTLKIGVMEVNYGDEHFRRSDNGNVIKNPFVGNYIMDAFTTAPALEVMFRSNGWIGMVGTSTFNLKPTLTGYSSYTGQFTPYNMGKELGIYGKFGFDKQFTDHFRLRATVSPLILPKTHSGSLYYGDRTGSRYYLVMKLAEDGAAAVDPSEGHMSGRWSPGFVKKDNSVMVNLFTKYYGFEFFGTYENAKGSPAYGGPDFKFSQYAAEGLYRFGKQEQFYGGARYNKVNNDQSMSVDRWQIDAGWKLTDNIIAKLEYVNQNYNNFISQYGSTAGFKGIMFEAGISF